MRRRLLLIALGLILACGETAATTTQPITTTSAGPTTTMAGPRLTTTTSAVPATTEASSVPLITVAGGEKVSGLDTLSVRAGEQVVFDVLADHADEVHVHGFDLHFPVVAGEATRVVFTPDATGIFEVELEASTVHILDIEVTP